MSARARVLPHEVLTNDFDLRPVIEEMPDSFVIKGMFLSRFAGQLPVDVRRALLSRLERAPSTGRFVPFHDYPQRDYMRVLRVAAETMHARLSRAEGLRRLARDDLETFRKSVLGKVVLSMVPDAQAALHKAPYVYERVAPGDWTLFTKDIDARTVEVEFREYHGAWPYTLGQLEGIVTSLGGEPAVEYEELDARTRRFLVRHR